MSYLHCGNKCAPLGPRGQAQAGAARRIWPSGFQKAFKGVDRQLSGSISLNKTCLLHSFHFFFLLLICGLPEKGASSFVLCISVLVALPCQSSTVQSVHGRTSGQKPSQMSHKQSGQKASRKSCQKSNIQKSVFFSFSAQWDFLRFPTLMSEISRTYNTCHRIYLHCTR